MNKIKHFFGRYINNTQCLLTKKSALDILFKKVINARRQFFIKSEAVRITIKEISEMNETL